jgi:hypothetical protein
VRRSLNNAEPSSIRYALKGKWIEYDDSAFFREIRSEYASLAGRWRHFSARTLSRVRVAPAGRLETCGSSDDFGRRHQCYSRTVPTLQHCAEIGHHDSFSGGCGSNAFAGELDEGRFMLHFRRPDLGKSQHAWVRWAQGIARDSGPRWTERREKDGREGESGAKCVNQDVSSSKAKMRDSNEEKPPGRDGDDGRDICFPNDTFVYRETSQYGQVSLDFTEGWSIPRVLAAFFLVLILAVVAVLVWVFLGISLNGVGYRGSSERVGTGLLMGVLVLLLGWAGIGLWLWISSLVV